jgi:tetratricopeptide (TPR) repeat protein
MKSGLWILVAVLVAGVIVGMLLRPRLTRLVEDQAPPAVAELAEIERIEDPGAKAERLRVFISENPASEVRHYAYRSLARTMLLALQDTSGYLEFADPALAEETDPESKAELYYWLYNVHAASDSGAAVRTAYSLLGETIGVSWIYNYVGYDLAERGYGLDAALGLCDRALEFADSRRDSAGIIDSRGWVYFKMGEYDRAVADLEMAVDLFEPSSEEILRHLVYAALKAGRSDMAFETLKTILMMGEYAYARAGLDSLMDVKGYSPAQRSSFEESVWEARLNAAGPGEAFTLPTLSGDAYEFEPGTGKVAVINFMSPT